MNRTSHQSNFLLKGGSRMSPGSKMSKIAGNNAKSKLKLEQASLNSSDSEDDVAQSKNKPKLNCHYVYLPLLLSEKNRRSMMLIVGLNNLMAVVALLISTLFGYKLRCYINGKSRFVSKDAWVLHSTPLVMMWASGGLILFQVAVHLLTYLCRFSYTRIYLIKYGVFKWFQFCNLLVVIFISPILVGFLLLSEGLAISMFHKGIRRLMEDYIKTEENKLLLDNMQKEFECCGSLSHSDWYGHSAWIHNRPNGSFCNLSIFHLSKYRITKRADCKFVPFSCCNITSIYSCSMFVMDSFQQRTIYQVGCSKKFGQIFRNYLYRILLSWAVVYGVQMTTLIVFQLLRTSIHNSIIGGHPKVTAFGWLWGKQIDDIDQEELMKIEKLSFKMPVRLISEVLAQKELEQKTLADQKAKALAQSQGRQFVPSEKKTFDELVQQHKPKLFAGMDMEQLEEQSRFITFDKGVLSTVDGAKAYHVRDSAHNVDYNDTKTMLRRHQSRRKQFSNMGGGQRSKFGSPNVSHHSTVQSKYSPELNTKSQAISPPTSGFKSQH